MNCLSHRALLRAAVSAGAAAVMIATASGAYAGIGAFRAVDLAPAMDEEEPAIRFTGSAMAPLVCTSTPDTAAVTITDETRITLANLTGADATVDTGTDQTLAVADGIGVSVKFRPGQYTVRMVPDCTMTNSVAAAVVTVQDAEPVPTPTPRPVPTPTPTPTEPTLGAGPTPTSVATSPTVDPTTSSEVAPPPISTDPGAPASQPASGSGGSSGSSGRPRSSGTAGGTVDPTTTGGSSGSGGSGGSRTGHPPSAVALPAGSDPVIYDVLMVPVQQPGDPRDGRLLAVIAVICVLGVTTAIIRAILSQRARGMVST